MPNYFEPSNIDVSQAVNMNRLGMADWKSAQDRETAALAGGALASGDYKGGAAAAFQGGNIDMGLQISKALQQRQEHELEAMKRQHSAIGNLAMMADTPEKWAQAVQAAKASGMQLPAGADAYTYRDVAISKAGMAGEAIIAELKRRQEEKAGLMSVAPGQTIYDAGTGKTVFTAPQKAATLPGLLAPDVTQQYGIGGDVRGAEYLGNLERADPQVAAYARDVLSGRESLPNLSKANSELAARVGAVVRQADPTFYAGRFDYAKKWRDPNAATGKTNIAFNNAMGHMGQLSQLNEANNDPMLGKLVTSPQKWWAGITNDPWLKDWQANSGLLADEIVKVGAGTAGALADREAILHELDPANGKAAIDAALGKYFHMMESKAHANKADWHKNMGPHAEAPEVIDPANVEIRDKMLSRYAQASKGYTPKTSTKGSKLQPVGKDMIGEANAAVAAMKAKGWDEADAIAAVKQRLLEKGYDLQNVEH